jgi:hypothetical protein
MQAYLHPDRKHLSIWIDGLESPKATASIDTLDGQVVPGISEASTGDSLPYDGRRHTATVSSMVLCSMVFSCPKSKVCFLTFKEMHHRRIMMDYVHV